METKALKIIKKANHDFRYPMELDLADSEHAEYLAECFGGEEHFKTHYPDIYALYQNGISRAVKMKEDGIAAAPRKGFADAAYIVDVLYLQNEKCAYAIGDMNLTQTAKRLFLSMDIYRDDVMIAHNSEHFSNETYSEIACRSEKFEISQGEVQKYKAMLTATWQPKDADYLRAMLAYESSASSYGTSDDVVEQMTVNDPAHKQSPESGPIKVAYARKASDLDYCYPESREQTTNLEKVFLDMSGEVKLKDKHKFSRLIEFDAVLQCDGYGTIFYNRDPDSTQIFPSADNTSFSWKLNNDWDNTIPDSVRFGNRQHSFDMQIKFYCDGDDTVHRIVVSSDDYPELKGLNSYQKISPIQLYWGCVAEDTWILMADGTTKKAKDIVEGDKIADKDGNADTVTHITTGTNQTIYHLKLVSGQELLATDTHPIYTEKGFVALLDIDTQSKVLTADGSGYSEVIYCYPEKYTGEVYSFDLQNSNTLCTNGIVTGSGAEQGKLADMVTDNNAFEPDADVLAEIKQMKADSVEGIFLG